MLQKMKTLIFGLNGGATNDYDDTLNTLLDMATSEAVDYSGCDDIKKLENIIVQMAVIKYNQLGAEGLQSENYSGGSYTYLTDYPEQILKQLRQHKAAKYI